MKWLSTIGILALLALVGIPLAEMLAPWVWALGMGLVMAVMVGARGLTEKLGGWLLGLVLFVSFYAGFAQVVREAIPPGAVVLLLLFGFVLLGLTITSKANVRRRREATRVRPGIRRRIPVVEEPEDHDIAPWAAPANNQQGASDDLGLFGSGK